MLNISSKLLQYRSIFLIILFATSLLFTSYIQNSKAQVQEDEETAYLKFASQAVKDSSNSSSSSETSTSTTTSTQIPEAAKGPQYLQKDI